MNNCKYCCKLRFNFEKRNRQERNFGQSSQFKKKMGMLDFPDSHDPKPTCDSVQGVYQEAAVVSNTEYCSSIGRDVLKKGGSAVDAAIATLLCEGLCAMQNMGIGGGCFMTIYNKQSKSVSCLDAREAAPLSAKPDMYNGCYLRSASGNLSVAVPGELMGYWEAHKKFGKLPWGELFQPAISMCLRGIPVNKRLAKSFSETGMGSEIMNSESLRKVLAENGKLPTVGDTFRLPILAKTLTIIAKSPKGALELYNGTITETFIEDLKKLGCIITTEDMNNYRAVWKHPVMINLEGDYIAYSAPPPASGVILLLILKVLENVVGHDPKANIIAVVEAFKYAYALRSELGDPNYEDLNEVLNKISSASYICEIKEKILKTRKTGNCPEDYGAKFTTPNDHGTVNIVVLAPNGDAVSVTSTINTFSPNIINSFNLPPSPANYIKGGKRPLSSSCPTVVLDKKGDVHLVTGAAGGTHITTSTAQVIMNFLWFDLTVKQAVDMPRLHHQLFPMALRYEEGIETTLLQCARRVGHKLKKRGPSSSVTAIGRKENKIIAIYDYRRGGSTAGF
ncbi:glutathione hydrolase 1 proenzyme isoform X3 [Halyomorpha halys]|uniref:glutathione hydrolase 1 proenzyme isoform X3 n=1 Tax=Halyomorpha halys TaxID=286706 RepID=UPI0034D1B393